MKQRYLNNHNLPLSVAVYLATDNYDHDPNTISATRLIRPVRQNVLTPRVPKEMSMIELVSVVKSRMGSSIHDGIEKSWIGNYRNALMHLGYSEQIVDQIMINPDPKTLKPGQIPVYLEQRHYREISGVTISGKFDFCAEGRLEDFKSTSTFTWVNQTKDDNHKLQGSIYRWLAPHIITEDYMAIQYFFTDWMPSRTSDPAYPKLPVMEKRIPLLSLDETEQYVQERLDLMRKYQHAPEEELPRCTDEELWRKAPQFKYYKNPDKRTRSTKNFDTSAEAYARKAKDGNVGVVVEVPGEVVACKYCPAFVICSQKDELIADGSLIL